MSGNLPSIENWAKSANSANSAERNNRTLSNLAARARAAKPFRPSGAALPGFNFKAPQSSPRVASFTNRGNEVIISPKPRKSRKGRKDRKSRKSRNTRQN